MKVKREARRFNAVDCGRRWGKSQLGIDVLTEPALNGYPVGWFSPTYKMLADVWRDMASMLQPVTQRISVQEHRLELVTGGVIDMWSLEDQNAGRGRKYKRVVVDEAAMIANLEQSWQASIRPTLTDYAGDGFFFSTPRGYNFFRKMWGWGRDDAYPEWMSWQMPTSDNPFIPLKEIEAARHDMPERIFSQEYLAKFLDDGGGVFRKVRQSALGDRAAIEQAGRITGHTYTIGVDWGRTGDATVFTVIDVETRAVAFWDRMTETDYGQQTNRLRALWERFGKPAILAELNSMGGPLVENLQRLGLNVTGFVTSNATKAEIIDGLALAFEREEISLLPDEMALGELEAYESERLPSGLIRYGAPAGLHDDYVISLALAWYAAAQGDAAGEMSYAQPYTIGSAGY